MQTSSAALLLALGPVAYAASGDNTVQNQIALWVPNPCDRFWDLPNALRQSFINYNRGKVPDLNVITAYSTYTVASASPGPTDTWSFNNQGPTPVLTSAYNSANCSWYYPPPAASTSQPTSQPTGTSVSHCFTDDNKRPVLNDEYRRNIAANRLHPDGVNDNHYTKLYPDGYEHGTVNIGDIPYLSQSYDECAFVDIRHRDERRCNHPGSRTILHKDILL
ncbi:hypothetical protein MANI_022112 [Metarhizium anisopliae]|nr:hypothetical protein MANI_022112 [Metarhizium anisopliae]